RDPMSSAPASRQSSEARMASISMCPMRPDAPATATWCWLLPAGGGCTAPLTATFLNACVPLPMTASTRRRFQRRVVGGRRGGARGGGRRRDGGGGCGRRRRRAGVLVLALERAQLFLGGFHARHLAQLALGVDGGDELGLAGHG